MTNKIGYGKLAKNLYTKEIQDNIKGAKHIFVAQFSKVSVNSIFDLRKKLRPSKSSFLVVKNSLGRHALGAGPYKALGESLEGQCGFGISNDDVSKISKIFVTFSDENPTFKISGAYSDGQMFSSEMVKSLALLPSREALISKMLGSMNTPISNFVGVLNQIVCGVVNVLDQIRKSKEQK